MKPKLVAIWFGIIASIAGAVGWHYIEFAPRAGFEALAENVEISKLRNMRRDLQSTVWSLESMLYKNLAADVRAQIQAELREKKAALKELEAEIKYLEEK